MFIMPGSPPLAEKNIPEYQEDSQLSFEILRRLYWIETFFNRLAQPIIDKGFYGSLVQLDLSEEYQNAVSHEVTKTTQKIFSLPQLFDFREQIAIKVSDEEQRQKILRWRVFPNQKLFEDISFLLLIWVGGISRDLFFNFSEKN